MPEFSLADILLAQPSGGAFGTLSPQEEAQRQVTPADVLTGLYRGVEDVAKRNIEASSRQEIDPGALISATTMAAGAASPFAQPGAAGIFGGRLGAERLAAAGKPEALQAMTKAEQMFGAGATPEQVYTATKISRGPEGGLRFEIPDYASGFRPQAQEHILPVTTGGQGVIEPKAGEMAVGYSPAKVLRKGQPALVEHVYAHPEAYEAYPDLGSLLLKFEDPLPKLAKGGFISRGGLDVGGSREVYLNPEAIPQPERMRSTLLHELQHGVQSIEGHPAGGGIGVPEVRQAADKAIAQRVADWEAQLAAVHAQRDAYVEAQRATGRPDELTPLMQEFWKKNPDLVRQTGELYTKIDQAQRGVGRQMELTKQYKNLAGEVESRNVQARADMTPEELAATPPSQTADVPLEQQLIRYGNRDEARIALSPPPALEAPPAPYRTPEQLRLLSAEPLSFSERMAQAQDVAFQRAQRGQATGDYGLGSARRTAPEAPKGSFEDLAARQRAGFAGDKERIIDEYRAATGQPRLGTERPLLAPGEEDIAFQTAPRGGGGSGGGGPPYDPFLHDPYPNAPFPQYADVYPPTGPPTMKPRGPGKEGTYPAKTLTPEGEAVAKAREKIVADMEREGYRPFFDPSQRFPAEFEKQPGPHVDTAQAVAKKQETIAKHLETIGAPETLARLRAGYSRGLDLPDAQAWYLMGQVERKMIEDMGEEAGRKHFRDSFATAMAATTTNMTPPQNLIMAQYLNYLRATGQPYPTAAFQTPVAVGGQRTMPNIKAYAKTFSDPREPYESLGLQNPKRTDFAQAQMGNPNAFTIDEQMAHGMLGVDVPQEGTYGLITKVGREEAARAGVEPQRYQDVGWAGFKKMVEEQSRAKKGFRPYGEGEGYQGKPMISEVNDMIERIHRLTGRPRADVWHKVFIEHSIPIYGLGGALTLGGVLQGQMGPAPPQ